MVSALIPFSRTPYPEAKMFSSMEIEEENYQSLHHLIARSGPEEKIKEWIALHAAYLNEPDPKYGLTPISICVITCNREAIRILVKNKVRLDIPDRKGCTPFHHAAVLQDMEMLDILKTADRVDEVMRMKNRKGETYQDIQTSLEPPDESSLEPVFRYQRDNGEILSGNAHQFKTMTGTIFCNRLYITPSEIARDWECDPIDIPMTGLYPFIIKAFEEARLSNPPLYLSKKDGENGCHVCAEKEISAFQPLTIYGGKFDEKAESLEYVLGEINSQFYRNIGGVIQDGFPNCMPFPCELDFKRWVFITLRPIAKGEELLWNYGPHQVKFLCHKELAPQELEEFFKGNNIYKKYMRLDFRAQKSEEATKKDLAFRNRLDYLMATPSAQLHLLIKRLLPVQQLRQIFEDKDFGKFRYPVERYDELSYYFKDFRIFEELDAILSKIKDPQLLQAICDQLQEWSATQRMDVLIPYLQSLIEPLKKVKTKADWNMLLAHSPLQAK